MKFKDPYLNHVHFCQECFEKIKRARSRQFGDEPPTVGIVCDASCWDFQGSKNRDGYFNGKVEWQAMDLSTGEMIVQSHVQQRSTVNIGEFIAIIDSLKWLHEKGDTETPVYSDSKITINWVKQKYTNTALPRNSETIHTLDDLEEALAWLRKNNPSNPVHWWAGYKWGENPADYGRK